MNELGESGEQQMSISFAIRIRNAARILPLCYPYCVLQFFLGM